MRRKLFLLILASSALSAVIAAGVVLSQPTPGLIHTENFVSPPAQIEQGWLNAINAEPGVERFRILELELQPGLPQDPSAAVITLFPGVTFLAKTQRHRVFGLHRFGWYGSIPSDPNGSIHFSWHHGGLHGEAVYQGVYYRAMRLEPGVFVVMEMENMPKVADGGAL